MPIGDYRLRFYDHGVRNRKEATGKKTGAQGAISTYAEMLERMRQFKAQPVVSPPVRKKVFEVSEEDLDSTKPLKMLPPK